MYVTSATGPNHRRCLFHFSLRAVLTLTLFVSVIFGVLRLIALEATRQRKVVADLEARGLFIHPTDDESWIPDLFDIWYCDRVDAVLLVRPLNDDDLSPISEFTNVKVIIVSYSEVADISPLARLRHLEYLDLTNTRVTDISPLAGLDSLTVLNVSFSDVTDLSPLTKLTKLERLDVRGTDIEQRQIDELQQAIPDCSIIDYLPQDKRRLSR